MFTHRDGILPAWEAHPLSRGLGLRIRVCSTTIILPHPVGRGDRAQILGFRVRRR